MSVGRIPAPPAATHHGTPGPDTGLRPLHRAGEGEKKILTPIFFHLAEPGAASVYFLTHYRGSESGFTFLAGWEPTAKCYSCYRAHYVPMTSPLPRLLECGEGGAGQYSEDRGVCVICPSIYRNIYL